MAGVKDRVFAGFGAFLFLASACTVTILIIFTSNSTDTSTTQTTESQCLEDQTETPLPEPEVYKPDGDVTELQTTDLEVGTGKELKTGGCAIMKYYGTLASNGEKFDENFTTTDGFAMTLGAGTVIPGWENGLAGMKEGGVRRLVIPSDQAYGETGREGIPPNADLVFVVKLLRIKELK